MRLLFFTVLLSLTLPFSKTTACTGIKLIAHNGSVVHGRTWEFGIDLDASMIVIPKGYAFTGTTPIGCGMPYIAKYGALGIIAFNQLAILDGMNEAGLSVAAFHFSDHGEYAEITDDNRHFALSSLEFPNWLLTQFSTVEEVRAALHSVLIAPTIIREWGKNPPSLHYIIFDKKGKSLVLEPIKGQLALYENKLGVLTSAPHFNWHMNHLRQFIHLGIGTIHSLELNAIDLLPIGQGTNIHLPGDLTPSSRFVRAALLCNQAKPMENSEKTVIQAFHLLNQFDIPFGIAREEKSGFISNYFTRMTCVRDPHLLKYYFKTYSDPAIRMIDLNQFDLNDAYIKRIRISTTDQPISDISSELE